MSESENGNLPLSTGERAATQFSPHSGSQSAAGRSPGRGLDASPPLILLVEDNPLTRKMFRLTLESDGYEVCEAADGRAALECMARRLPDLVCMDLHLPDLSGFELIEQLRVLAGGTTLPILAISGAVPRLGGRLPAAHFQEILTKPVAPSVLLKVVKSYLPERSESKDQSGQGRHVLVVDDEPIALKLTRLRLEQLGYRVSTAEHGAAALEQARRSPPDFIVSDVLMPELDGFGLSLAVRQDPRLTSVPLILTSANFLEEEDRQMAMKAGADAYVVKTPDMQAVIDAMSLYQTGETRRKEPVVPLGALGEQYARRLIRQLERQSKAAAELAQRNALLSAELSILSGISDALTGTTEREVMLREVLTRCLEAGELTAGALYLVEPRIGLTLQSELGIDEQECRPDIFFGHPELLQRAMEGDRPVILPSPMVPEAASGVLLARTGWSSALILPLTAREKSIGALLLGSNRLDITDPSYLGFARTVAGQIGQAIALATAFTRLAASEARKRLLIESIQDSAIFMLDPGGRVESWNGGAQRILGYGESEVLGVHFSHFYTEEDVSLEKYKLAIRVAARLGKHEELGWRVRRDGSWLWTHTITTALRDQKKTLRGFSHVMRDITRRKQTEDAIKLLSSSLDYQATLDGVMRLMIPNLADLCICDLKEADGSLRRAAVLSSEPGNEALLQTICEHFPLGGIADAGPSAVLRSGSSEMVAELQGLNALASEHPASLAHLRVLGRLGFQSYLCVPLPGPAGSVGVITLASSSSGRRFSRVDLDLAEEVAAKAALALENARLYREAERAIRTREDVIAVVSHDLRNPLTSIKLMADVIARALAEHDAPPKLRDGAQRIKRTADHVIRQLGQLLDLSRMEAGFLTLERAPVDLVDLLLDATEQERPIAAGRGVQLEIDAAPEQVVIPGDRDRLLQVLSNLLGNAVKFTPASGTVTVLLGQEAAGVRVTVRDTGPGIPPERVPHLFDRYWQPRQSAHAGAGLGLFIARGIVEAHGGQIWAESRPGFGSSFHFTLPAGNSAPQGGRR